MASCTQRPAGAIGSAAPPRATCALARRACGWLLLLALTLVCVEPLLADSCDGDASAGREIATQTGGGSETPSPRQPEPPIHRAHLCHCAHVHVGLPGFASAILVRAEIDLRVNALGDRVPLSPAVEPPLRPPLIG